MSTIFKIFLAILAISITQLSNAQTKTATGKKQMNTPPKETTTVTKTQVGDKIIEHVTITEEVEMNEDEFLDGLFQLEKYTEKHIKRLPGVHGVVTVGFNIETDGSLSGVKIVKGLNKEADADVIKVLKAYPHKLAPSKENGIAGRSFATTGIRFK